MESGLWKNSSLKLILVQRRQFHPLNEPPHHEHLEYQDMLKNYRMRRLKGSKREYSNARTPQQNEVAEKKNETLIEAAKTMLADSFLPTTFWVEAVNTALENQANKSAGPKEASISVGTQDNNDQSANSEEIDLHEEHFVLPIWSAYSTTVKSSGNKTEKNTDYKTREKPVSQVKQIFLEELKKLKKQEKEANDAAELLRKEATHDIQNDNTSNDPSMPYLEDIYTSPSEEI
nr:ribonuclease H-like domain-containing protein [Tanacetum cinerariifolium]